jgi:DNA-binding transcriptional ArsR family regulator
MTAAAIDLMFHALADRSRRAMIERLSLGPASVSQLAAPLAMSLPAAVQHLQVLQDAGLITTQKIGRVRSCNLHAPAMSLAEQWINDRRSAWEQRLDRLGAFLEGTESGPETQP